MFESLLIFGAAGFVIMTLLGSIHVHGHGGVQAGHGHQGLHLGSADSPPTMSASHGHLGHAPLHAPSVGSHAGGIKGTSVKSGPHSSGQAQQTFGGSMRTYLIGVGTMFISPLDIFSVCLGTGAAGLLLREALRANPYLLEFAIAIGIAFDLIVARGMIKLALRFAAEPSIGLEGMVMHPVKAATAFDKEGRGLIEIVLDGQSSQLLATLDKAEVEQGIRVGKGDMLLVVEVNAKCNTCRVSRDLAPSAPSEGA